MNIRIKLIQLLIEINEKIFFYPKLKSFYKNASININSPVILDVGANKGQSIDFFKAIYPNCVIYAFEPNPRLYTALEKKYRDFKNIHLINKGVSDASGILELKETVTDETSTFEELNYDSNYLKMKSAILGVDPKDIVLKTHQVDVIKLSNFINEYKLNDIHAVKIDTEGHELKCLMGLFSGINSSAIKYIQLESHNDDMYLQQNEENAISDLLMSNGYPTCAKIKHGFGDFDELIYSKN
jgi:FkbM family methyltransferase